MMQTQQQNSCDQTMSDNLARTSLMVRNIESAKAWYQYVFSMVCVLDIPMTLENDLLAAGQNGDLIRLAVMRDQAGAGGTIGLLQWVSSEEKQNVPPSSPDTLPFHAPVMVISPSDAQATFARAVAAGSKVRSHPHRLDVALPDGSTKHMITCSFWDLDGHFYELIQDIESN